MFGLREGVPECPSFVLGVEGVEDGGTVHFLNNRIRWIQQIRLDSFGSLANCEVLEDAEHLFDPHAPQG